MMSLKRTCPRCGHAGFSAYAVMEAVVTDKQIQCSECSTRLRYHSVAKLAATMLLVLCFQLTLIFFFASVGLVWAIVLSPLVTLGAMVALGTIIPVKVTADPDSREDAA